MHSHFAVIADDSTGANASAGALAARAGARVPVFDRFPQRLSPTLVLNTRSREDGGRTALAAEWTRRLWDAGCRDFDKRMDTTLRGPCPEELKLLCQSLPEKPWIGVVAAFPDADRMTRGGQQHVDGRPASQVVSLKTDDIGEYLFGSRHACLYVGLDQSITAETLAACGEPVVFDAASKHDLIRIARLLHQVRAQYHGPFVTVSSGALLQYYPNPATVRTLVIMGSPTPVNVAQVNDLMDHDQTLSWPLDHSLSDTTNKPDTIILHSGLNPVRFEDRRDLSVHLAAQAIERLNELARGAWTPQRLILTGGEMAQSFLDASRAERIDIQRLAAPLVGHGRVVGGQFNQTEIMTKGGLVGDRTLLWELCTQPTLLSAQQQSTKEDLA